MKYILCIFIIIGINGCSLAPIHEDNLSTYSLVANNLPGQMPSAAMFKTNSVDETLMLTAMDSNPGFDTQNIVYSYSSQPYKLYHYANNVWVSPPAQMLLPQLALAIQNQHEYKAVVIPPYVGVSDIILSTRLLYLKQKFIDKQHSQIVGAIEATLIDSKSHKVLWTKRFQQTVDGAGANPASGVHAANVLVNDLLRKIAAFVRINVQ